jgi:aminopeptidase N
VEADFLDGMEFDGLYFLSRGFYNLYDGSPKGYLTMIAVHETAHQWWYTLVANDQAMEPWLDESLCTYSELLFFENTYPDLIDWWWNYRVNFYNPQGWINQPVYEYHGFVPYRDAVYLRGALFVQALRNQVGDETFFSFLSTYEQKFENKISSQKEFWQLLNEISGKDLSDVRMDFFLEENN